VVFLIGLNESTLVESSRSGLANACYQACSLLLGLCDRLWALASARNLSGTSRQTYSRNQHYSMPNGRKFLGLVALYLYRGAISLSGYLLRVIPYSYRDALRSHVGISRIYELIHSRVVFDKAVVWRSFLPASYPITRYFGALKILPYRLKVQALYTFNMKHAIEITRGRKSTL
jgi:hypothetical protein